MAIEAFGPLTRGPLSIFAQDSEKQKQLEFKVRLPRASGEEADDDEDAARESEARRTALPFNTHTDALRTAQEIDHGRKIVAALESSPPLSLLRGKEEEEEAELRVRARSFPPKEKVAALGKRIDVVA